MSFLAPGARAVVQWRNRKSRQGPNQREEEMDCVHHCEGARCDGGKRTNRLMPLAIKNSLIAPRDVKTSLGWIANPASVRRLISATVDSLDVFELVYRSVRISSTDGHSWETWETGRDKPKFKGKFCFPQPFDCFYCAWYCCWTDMERTGEVNEEGFDTVISNWLRFLFSEFNYLLEFGHW